VDLIDPPFREFALDRLRGALDDCRAGQGGVVTVTGPVGAGRTRLLGWFCRLAVSQGVLQLHARGVRAERNLPFGLLLQLLQQAPLDQDTSGEVCRLVNEGIASADPQDDWARLPARVLDAGHRAVGFGLFYTCYYVILTAGPAVAGWLRDRSGSTAAVSFFGAALFLAIPPLLLLFHQLEARSRAAAPA